MLVLETIAFWAVIAFIFSAIPITVGAMIWLIWKYKHTNY
jgi:hypothetical protein